MLKEINRQQFLKERKAAIGGSDVPSLLGLAPYGCERMLWYDKRDVPLDFYWPGNCHTRRGRELEEAAHEFFFEATGKGLKHVPWKVMAGEPYAGCHADALVENEGGYAHWLLETKIPQARVYYATRSNPEPPNDAFLQAQWGMMVHGVHHGVVQLFSADVWNHTLWWFDEDKTVQKDLLGLGKAFWASLKKSENPYKRLAKDDKRCRQCQWRKTCQGLPAEIADGDVFDPNAEALRVGPVGLLAPPEEVEEAAKDLLAAKKAMKAAEQASKLAKARLEGMFPAPGVAECGVGRITLKVIKRKAYTATVEATTYSTVTVKPKVEEIQDDDSGE